MQVFSSKYWKNTQITYFEEHLRTTAFELKLIFGKRFLQLVNRYQLKLNFYNTIIQLVCQA